MKTMISLLGDHQAFLKGTFSRQEMAQDFHCIMKSNKDEEDGVINDQKMIYA